MTMLVGRGFVFCQGPDGHLALEAPHGQEHCDSFGKDNHELHGNSETNTKELSIHDVECEPCVDTPFGLCEAVKPEKNKIELASIISQAPSTFDEQKFKIIKNISYLPPPPRIDSTQNLIRTVVLII